MTDDETRQILIRSVRQRLDALRRSGITSLPIQSWPPGATSPRAPVLPLRSKPIESISTQPLPAAPLPTIQRPSLPAGSSPAAPTRAVRPAGPPPIAASLLAEPELTPAVPESERAGLLMMLATEVSGCVKCPELAATRIQTVPGEGNSTARLMFVGEAPGADEDQSGRPFVGKAGALLTDMITKGMGLSRGDVFIANVLKCRPPDNRKPDQDEIRHCLGYLERQIATVRPEFLCLLGATAALALLETAIPLGKLRGKWHQFRGIPTIVTYHPAALLRNVAWKKDTWTDLQILMRAMGIKPPDRRKSGE